MNVRVAVLQFPGLNCETETQRALGRVGVEADVVRWNEPPVKLAEYAGFVIPGGWSYQDRIRAGVVAAKSPLVEALSRQVEKGKPVLGICNGAQILVEAGLAGTDRRGEVHYVLARNRVEGREGYHARWAFVTAGPRSGCFFTEGIDEPFPVPLAHGEGCFLTRDDERNAMQRDPARRALFYSDVEGSEATRFPDNPNGSPYALAGLSGLDGQVLAFMPHPERAGWLWQVPEDIAGSWGERRRNAIGDFAALDGAGPGLCLFRPFARLAEVGAS